VENINKKYQIINKYFIVVFDLVINILFPKNRYTNNPKLYFDKEYLKSQGSIAELTKVPLKSELVKIYGVYKYNDSLKKIIFDGKKVGYYEIFNSLSFIVILDLLYLTRNVYNLKDNEVLILPVPCDPKRYLERGFDVNNFFIQFFSKNYPTLDCLYKIKSTKNQSLLSQEDRITNNKDVFKIYYPQNLNNILNKNHIKLIIILDDIVTTGSSIFECVKIVKKNLNPENKNIQIIGFTIAY
jgi:ComF family protein